MTEQEMLVQPYVRLIDEQLALQECYARKQGLQGKSLQLLLWVTNYPRLTGRPISQKRLAEKTYSTKQVVNATIKSWLTKGYVELVADEDDRRQKQVVLTEQGRVFAEAITQPLNQIETKALAVLTPEEQATLLSLTAKYNQALKEEMEIRFND